MSIFVYGRMVPWFAWRPVNTTDAGWVWLRRIERRRMATRADLSRTRQPVVAILALPAVTPPKPNLIAHTATPDPKKVDS